MATAEPTPAPATEEKTTTSPVKPTLGKKTIDKPKAKELSPAEAQADRIRKYKVAADVVHQVLETVVPACVEGASVMQLCQDADAEIEKLTASVYNNTKKGPIQKGIAFPTCISINNVVSHFSPLFSDPLSTTTLADGDVVKIQLGANIDGYASVQTETLIVGATKEAPATGRKADVVKAAWTAAEVALRSLKAEEKNFAITDIISKTAGQWDCKPVEGMLSCEHNQGIIDGKKRIILNPTSEQRVSHDKASFAVGDVFGIDVLVTSQPDGKCKTTESRTSVYQRISGVNYQVKLKTSKEIIADVEKKYGFFPFNVRTFEDEKKARVGISEGEKHGVFRGYEVTQTPKDTYVAAFMFTAAITENGPSLLTHPPIWYAPEKVKTEKELADDDLKALLTQSVHTVPTQGRITILGEKPKKKRIRHPKKKDAEGDKK